MRPHIALSTYVEDVRWGAWDRHAHVLPAGYARAVYRAGGCPILLHFAQHSVTLAAGSWLATVLGPLTNVATHHHQAVHELGQHATAVGWAEDGIIEAIEIAGRSLAVGVQWHPEESEDARLIAALVKHAAKEETRGGSHPA
jgi:gamma-glutamyl-gamma-aminobutyrate hydrolase PuuD